VQTSTESRRKCFVNSFDRNKKKTKQFSKSAKEELTAFKKPK